MAPIAAPGSLVRCWPTTSEQYIRYHDAEWGRPVLDERGLFERMSLEGFQSGLSWLTILRKREAFRSAFALFDPERVAAFGQGDVDRLLGDAGIVRNRAKIEATIGNARAALALREAGSPLAQLVWSHRPDPGPPPARMEEVPSVTPASLALSKELKARGFRFVGPTTAYAAMQACGLVNDHLAACFVREDVAKEQEEAAAAARWR